ncbi:MAG: DUF4278 domain-containing protein [Cyanobacteria bacterium P01_C01_bin.73]
MVFLILLALALGAVGALLLLLVGLFEAPWPVLLVGLLLALVALQRIAVQAEEMLAVDEADIAPKSQHLNVSSQQAEPKLSEPSQSLSYRGVRYTQTSPAQPSEASSDSKEGWMLLEGVYRGKHWRATQRPCKSAANADEDLIYRGQKVKKQPPAH